MTTHLVTWNPDKWEWADFEDCVEATRAGEIVDEQWSVARRRNGIDVGDRVFMLRQGSRGRGLVGVGVIYSEPFEEGHWSGDDETTMYAEMVWTELLEVADRIDISVLESRITTLDWRYILSSGRTVDAATAAALETLWAEHSDQGAPLLPGAVIDAYPVEGAARRSLVTRYERSSWARRLCIEAHGTTCNICEFDFGSFYGPRGEGYIHVHHIEPLHRKGYSHEVDPVKDLRPVCANCHAMLHRGPLMTPAELKAHRDRLAAQKA